MTDRIYRAVLGLAILVSLYFGFPVVIYAVVIIMFLEGITRMTVPRLIGKVATSLGVQTLAYRAEPCNQSPHFNYESEAMWRIMIGAVIGVTYAISNNLGADYEYLGYVPWFLGFVVFGAGLSNICPGLMLIRWLGFK